MALTAAERMARYRERLKSNPAKREILRKKNLEQIKGKKKKIAELTEEEKIKQREEWAKQKRQQRQNKKNGPDKNFKAKNAETGQKELKSQVKAKIKYLIKKCNKLVLRCRRQEEELALVKTANEKLKKRAYRNGIAMKSKNMDIHKLKARQEMLENAMSQAYKNCVKIAERNVFKKVVANANNNKKVMASLLGLKGKIRSQARKPKASYNEEIVNFFHKDDVSRCTAGKKECRTKHKDKQQIRYLTDTLLNLYQKYKDEGGKSKFSTFHRHKPFYVLSPHLSSRNTCLCIKHSNIEFQLNVLQRNDVFKQKSIKDLLQTILCDVTSYMCAHGKCNKCKTLILQHDVTADDLKKEVTWQQWERIDHEYVKGIYWATESQSFCTISPDNCHQPAAIWAHLKPILKLVKEHTPGVDVVHFYSDGPTSQYRQKHNFMLLSKFQQQLGFKHVTWSFFEAGHGKGVADGIGGTVKRALDKHVCFGKDVTNANDAFEILNDAMKIVRIFYVPESDIAEISSLIPSGVKPLKGTLQLHQIIAESPAQNISKHIVKYRDISCFCRRGLCTCFGLKMHTLCDILPTVRQCSPVQDNVLEENLSISPLSFPMDIEEIEHDSLIIDMINLSPSSNVISETEAQDKPYSNKITDTFPCNNNKENALDNNNTHTSLRGQLPMLNEEVPLATADSKLKNVKVSELKAKDESTSNDDHNFLAQINNPKYKTNTIAVNVNKIAKTVKQVISKPAPFRSSSEYDQLNNVNVSESKAKNTSTLNDDHDFLAQFNNPKYKMNTTAVNTNKIAKTVKQVIRRTFKCDSCHNPLISNQIAKCMVCKKCFCWNCNGGYTFTDYICQGCLNE